MSRRFQLTVLLRLVSSQAAKSGAAGLCRRIVILTISSFDPCGRRKLIASVTDPGVDHLIGKASIYDLVDRRPGFKSVREPLPILSHNRPLVDLRARVVIFP